MANIQVRKDGGATPAPRAMEWDPLRWARDMLRWDPFREMLPTPSLLGEGFAFAPAFEVKETRDAYVFKADVPGVEDKDIDISRTGNRLTVSGKREAEHEEKTDTFYALERSYGSFSRAFTLPDGIDGEHVRAELNKGVLTIVVPKVAEAQARKIPVGLPSQKKS
jgi:HSP20 family protein